MEHDSLSSRILTFTEEQQVTRSRGREMKNITVWMGCGNWLYETQYPNANCTSLGLLTFIFLHPFWNLSSSEPRSSIFFYVYQLNKSCSFYLIIYLPVLRRDFILLMPEHLQRPSINFKGRSLFCKGWAVHWELRVWLLVIILSKAASQFPLFIYIFKILYPMF